MGAPLPNEPVGAYDANGDGKPDDVAMKGGKGLGGMDITLSDQK
jgi:hypothetical protein